MPGAFRHSSLAHLSSIQALATSVVVDRDYAWEVPANWSLAEASTVPVVYTTAYYALVCRGRIKKVSEFGILKPQPEPKCPTCSG